MLITRFDESNSLVPPLSNTLSLDFNTLIDNEGYDVNLLLQGAINNDREAKEYLEYLVHRANSTSPLPFQIVNIAYQLKEPISIHASFLSTSDINFITTSLEGKVDVVYVSIHKDSVLFVNPYNANYFIYDSFTTKTLPSILSDLHNSPTQASNDKYVEILE